MRFRQTVCVALVAMMVAGTGQWVDTFYDDTHYAFTYYMARECGFTPLQSHRLASANLAVDYSIATEPVRKAATLGEVALQSPAAIVLGPNKTPFSAAAQQPRVDFHAMRNALVFGRGQEAQADQAIRLQEAKLWASALALRNPGVLLHFVQDEPSHAGYASATGHWLGNARVDTATRGALDPLADPSLPMGATPDFLSYRPDKTNLMIAKTVEVLQRFRLAMSPKQRAGNCTAAHMQGVKDRLTRANFVTPTIQQYSGQLPGQANDSAPDVVRADSVVSNALSSDVIRYIPARILFELGPTGQPINKSPDDFTLYGTVTTRLRRSGPQQEPVEVSIWAKPTRDGESLHQMDCKTVTGPGIEGGPILPGILDRLPVGSFVVRAVTSSGKVIEKDVRLDQLELEVFLDIPAAPEKESSCGKKVADAVRQMCTATGRFSKSSTNLDEDFKKELKNAEECEDKEEEKEKEEAKRAETNTTTPTATAPPPSSGPSIGKILGWTTLLGGAVVGGVYVAQQAAALAEESYTTTTTTTGNVTPVTPSNTPSTFSVGSFSCTAANSTSNLRTCTGSINIRAGTLMGARQGSSLGALTNPSFMSGSFTAPATGGTTGTVTLRATVTGCPAQTAVSFLVTGGQPFETISASIPMSCP